MRLEGKNFLQERKIITASWLFDVLRNHSSWYIMVKEEKHKLQSASTALFTFYHFLISQIAQSHRQTNNYAITALQTFFYGNCIFFFYSIVFYIHRNIYIYCWTYGIYCRIFSSSIVIPHLIRFQFNPQNREIKCYYYVTCIAFYLFSMKICALKNGTFSYVQINVKYITGREKLKSSPRKLIIISRGGL